MQGRASAGGCLLLALTPALALPALALDWLREPPVEEGKVTLAPAADGRWHFLRFGSHLFAPAAVTAPVAAGPAPVLVAPFQQLWMESRAAGAPRVEARLAATRDAFWDRVITVEPAALGPLPAYPLVETGAFGAALPEAVRQIDLPEATLAREEAALVDPVIPARVGREIPWDELARQALPLDFQKVLLASPHDPSPGFAYQNGQWFTSWPGRDLPPGAREDHWFAPALLVDGVLVRPAPLSARTAFLQDAHGTVLPVWTLEWQYRGMTVRQRLFSHRPADGAAAQVHVRLELSGATPGVRLVLGLGRRPSAHYWDCAPGPRTPVPCFSLEPRFTQAGRTVLDATGRVVLRAEQAFTLERLGPLEQLAVFAADADGRFSVATPQDDSVAPDAGVDGDYAAAERAAVAHWSGFLAAGAQVRLPAAEWQARVDAWRTQVEAITRVRYDGRERLSYGAWFYQAYFGIEEAWPVVALALWGRGDEAKRQAEIMLEPENLDKTNVHHQSRNGAAPLAAATVARLTGDAAWLERVAPALIACADWTDRVCRDEADTRPPLTRGLLPPHIYGGDVRDPATSLYATAACWRGMQATADAFLLLGTPELWKEGARLATRAAALRDRLATAFRTVTDRSAEPAFVPLALALPSLQGRNEGPYDRLTATRYGNYWNLFAPSFLELDYRMPGEPSQPNESVFAYGERHGGLWAGLPRFNAGLDAAYAVGNLGYLLDRATRDASWRPQAIAGLEAFMLHAASRNGYTIPEVAGLFPERLQAAAYERTVREAPWSFGMYDADQYLAGRIPCTEPLGAVAGSALTLIRRALLAETRDDLGNPDGGLVLLPAVPADWLAEGKEIKLEEMPTAYGRVSVTIRSAITSRREVVLEYRFVAAPASASAPLQFRFRCAVPGEPVREMVFSPERSGTVRIRF